MCYWTYHGVREEWWSVLFQKWHLQRNLRKENKGWQRNKRCEWQFNSCTTNADSLHTNKLRNLPTWNVQGQLLVHLVLGCAPKIETFFKRPPELIQIQSHSYTYTSNYFNSQRRLKRLYLTSKYQLVQLQRCVLSPTVQPIRWQSAEKQHRGTIFFSYPTSYTVS